jgi:accessory colonization factor AcfC
MEKGLSLTSHVYTEEKGDYVNVATGDPWLQTTSENSDVLWQK